MSSQGAFDPEAEMPVARAAGAKKQLMILSTSSNSSASDVAKAHGGPIWFQLYPTDDWNVTRALIKRAEEAGVTAIVLTVDRQGGRNTETLFRARRQDDRQCVACHAGGFKNEVSRKAAFNDIDVSRVTNMYGTGMTWDFVAKLRAATKAKVVLKGIMTGDDAARAVKAGVEGIFVSNHGGAGGDARDQRFLCHGDSPDARVDIRRVADQATEGGTQGRIALRPCESVESPMATRWSHKVGLAAHVAQQGSETSG